MIRIVLEHRAQLLLAAREVAAIEQALREPVVTVDGVGDADDEPLQRGLGIRRALDAGEPEVGLLVVGLELDRAAVGIRGVR